MNCETINLQLDDYLDGRLAAAGREPFDAHVAECESCRRALGAARQLQSALAALPVEPATQGFAERALANAARAAVKRRSRPPRLVAAGFVAAFAASIVTMIYTGLLVRSPEPESGAGLPMVSMTIDERRTVNLVFASSTELEDVSLTVDLPRGVELLGYEGLSQVRWNTRLQSGKNVLPLELIALGGMGGQLTARLQHGDREKVFRVNVSVISG